jgi:hypothetical protein
MMPGPKTELGCHNVTPTKAASSESGDWAEIFLFPRPPGFSQVAAQHTGRRRAAIAVAEHQFMPITARTMISEECRALVRQHHVTRLAALALPDRQRIGIGIEVAHFQLCTLAVAAAGFQARRASAREILDRTC